MQIYRIQAQMINKLFDRYLPADTQTHAHIDTGHTHRHLHTDTYTHTYTFGRCFCSHVLVTCFPSFRYV